MATILRRRTGACGCGLERHCIARAKIVCQGGLAIGSDREVRDGQLAGVAFGFARSNVDLDAPWGLAGAMPTARGSCGLPALASLPNSTIPTPCSQASR